MTIINYTPHDVRVRCVDRDIVYPASGIIARVDMRSIETAPLPDGCPTTVVEYGAAKLPDNHHSDCIVSTMFADAYRRTYGMTSVRLFVPDSGPSAIRENGQIVAVRSLIRR